MDVDWNQSLRYDYIFILFSFDFIVKCSLQVSFGDAAPCAMPVVGLIRAVQHGKVQASRCIALKKKQVAYNF